MSRAPCRLPSRGDGASEPPAVPEDSVAPVRMTYLPDDPVGVRRGNPVRDPLRDDCAGNVGMHGLLR